MRKTTFPLLTIVLLLFTVAFSQQKVFAQSQAQIVEQIINLPQLQQHYPLNAENQKQVHIMQFPVSFPNMDISNADKDVVFMTRSDIENNKVNSYFMFRTIKESQNTSKVVCHYFYDFDYNTKKSNYFAITVDFQKNGNNLEIVKSDVKGGAL